MIKYSIVATSYNDANEIIRYLENICSQKYPPDEIVIADGGSKDDTVDKIKSYSKKQTISITVVQDGRLNISQGYNKAILAARNEWIGITGIGNIYDDTFFGELIKKADGYDVLYSPVRGYDSGSFSRKYNETVLFGEHGSVMSIASNHGALVKKLVFEQLGYFYERFIYAGEDAEFYDLVRMKGYKTKCVIDACVRWITPNSLNEYIRQKRVYAIGDLQIQKNNVILKRIIRFFVPLPILVAAFIFSVPVGVFVLSAGTFYVMLKFFNRRRKGKADFLIWLIEKYNKPFEYLRNIKYLKAEYKVRR